MSDSSQSVVNPPDNWDGSDLFWHHPLGWTSWYTNGGNPARRASAADGQKLRVLGPVYTCRRDGAAAAGAWESKNLRLGDSAIWTMEKLVFCCLLYPDGKATRRSQNHGSNLNKDSHSILINHITQEKVPLKYILCKALGDNLHSLYSLGRIPSITWLQHSKQYHLFVIGVGLTPLLIKADVSLIFFIPVLPGAPIDRSWSYRHMDHIM